MTTAVLDRPAKDPTDEVPKLTAAEKRKLATYEATIREAVELQVRADAAYVEVGRAYRAIRLAKLYRTSHKTFEVYLHATWGKKLRTVEQLMDAAQVATAVEKARNCAVPAKESQARPLVPLMDKPTPTSEPSPESAQRLQEIWKLICDDAEENAVKITAGWIKRWLQERGYAPSPTPPQAAPMESAPHPGSSLPGNGHGNEQQPSYGNTPADPEVDDGGERMPPMEEDPWLYVTSSLDVAVSMAMKPATVMERKRIIALLKRALELLEGQA